MLRCLTCVETELGVQVGSSENFHERANTFWVDTICHSARDHFRCLPFAKWHRNAGKVLVLTQGCSKFQLSLTYIEISSWNELLWTIKEAAFARLLYF